MSGVGPLSCQAFDRNINEGERYITAALGELDGLPEDYQARMRAGADVDGNVNITTQYPDRNPIMQYAHSDALRQRMQQAYHDRAYPENEVCHGDRSGANPRANPAPPPWSAPYDPQLWGFGGWALFGLTLSFSSTRRRCEQVGAVSKRATELDGSTPGQ